MIPIGRIYETEELAIAAFQRLKDTGFPEDCMFLVRPGTAAEAIPGGVTRTHAIMYSRQLAQGSLTLVIVRAQFGWGERVARVLDECGPISTKDLPTIPCRNPAPFSSFFGLPTLSTRGGSYFSKIFPELTRPDFSVSSLVGMKLLSQKKSNWEESFRMKLLWRRSGPWEKSFGMKLLSRKKRPWTKSFGLPLLTENR